MAMVAAEPVSVGRKAPTGQSGGLELRMGLWMHITLCQTSDLGVEFPVSEAVCRYNGKLGNPLVAALQSQGLDCGAG